MIFNPKTCSIAMYETKLKIHGGGERTKRSFDEGAFS